MKLISKELGRLEKILLAICAVGLVIGLVARFWYLAVPVKQMFDEVYFPVMANKYLHGEEAFDVHPPLGKFIIAAGMWLFGDNSFGWRIVPAIFGVANIALFVSIWHYLRGKKKDVIGLSLMALVVAIECILVAYSRIGLMDGLLFFFIFAAFFMSLWVERRQELVWLSIVIGLAISIKWVAAAVVIPIGYILWRKDLLWDFIPSLVWSAYVYMLVVFAGKVIGRVEYPLQGVITWNKQAWDYQTTLTATHPYSSTWWTWAIMKRPVLMLYDVDDAKNTIAMMTSIGNPLLWLSSTLAVAGSTLHVLRQHFLKKVSMYDHPLVPLIIGYLVFFLPWVLVHRVVFIYHYLPCYGFALLILVYWLREWWKTQPRSVIFFAGLALVLSVYFLPIVMGIPISKYWSNHHIWFKSWL